MAKKAANMWGDIPEDENFDPVPRSIKEAGAAELEEGAHEVIERPNILKNKVGPGTGMDPSALARAEAVIDTFKVNYDKRVSGELEDIDALFTEMKLTRRYDLRRILIACHEVRGEAGTFGYPLLSSVAQSLCELLPRVDTPTTIQLEVIEAHIKAMRTIVKHRIMDDGGALGKQVIKGLVKAVRKLKAELAASQ